MSSKPDQPASMIGGHATFAKGYVEETIGNVTGSMEWQESGKKDAQAGIDEMRTAKQQTDSDPAASSFGGKVEQNLGKVTGCEGMEEEGKARQEKA